MDKMLANLGNELFDFRVGAELDLKVADDIAQASGRGAVLGFQEQKSQFGVTNWVSRSKTIWRIAADSLRCRSGQE